MMEKLSAEIAIAAASIGSYFWAAALARRRTWLCLVEVVFLAAAMAIGFLLVAALVPATFGLFKTPLVALTATLYAIAGWFVFSRSPPRVIVFGVPRWSGGLLALTLVYAIATSWSASDVVLGGNDPGTYVAITGNVAREGTVYHTNSAVAALPDDVANALVPGLDGRYMELSGMVADPRVKGRTNPQFLHGFPSLLAVFKAAFGILGMLRVPVLAHILALVGLFLLVWRLFGSAIMGALSSLFLATDLAQLFYARTPYTEVPNQFIFIAAAWLLTVALRNTDRTLAILSAVLWTIGCLIRPDAYLAQAALFMAFAWIPQESPAAAIRRPFAWVLFLATIAAASLTSITSWQNYFKSTLRETLSAWALAAGSGALCLVSPVLWRSRFIRGVWNAIYRRASFVGWALTILLIAVVAWGYWIRPKLPPEICSDPSTCFHITGMRLYDEDTFVRLAWYISPIGLVAATIGAAGLVRRHFRQRDIVLLPFLTVGLAFSALFLWRQLVSPWHFWAFRRYVPIVLPFAVSCIAWAVVRLGSYRRMGLVAATALSIYLVAFGLRTSWPFIKAREQDGARAQVAAIAKQMPERAVLLSTHPLLPQSMLLIPLQSLYGFDVVRLPERVANVHVLETALSIWQGQGRPVVFFCEPDWECFWPAEHWGLRYRCDATIDCERACSTFDHAPNRVERLHAGFVAYDVVRARAEVPRWWDRPGNYVGFYGVEDWNGRRYRWTSGDAEIRVNVPPGPSELSLIAAANGTAQVPVVLSVGELVERHTLEPGFDKLRNLRIALPNDRGDTLQVRINTPTFKPAQLGSSDPRQLGIAVFGIRIGDHVLSTSSGEP
jgi:hypothetical protein